MKKKFNKKSLCLAAAALALTAGLSVNSAMAYFTTYTTAAGGVTISLGSTTTVPEETVSDWTKHIVIRNTGDFECYVRVKVFAGEKYQDGLMYQGSEKWTPGEEGYYYYSDIVPAGGETEELQVKIDSKDSEEEFNVIVAQECTPVVYDEQGNPKDVKEADWDTVQEEVGE